MPQLMTGRERRTSIRRLVKLSRLLRNLKAELPDLGSFNMGVFYMPKYGTPPRPAEQLNPSCGSAGCALGAAGLHPSFQREGFKIVRSKRFMGQFVPAFGNRRGMGAAVVFFGLTEPDVDHLFHARVGNLTPKEVARNIVRFMRKEFRVDRDGHAIAGARR